MSEREVDIPIDGLVGLCNLVMNKHIKRIYKIK